MYLSKGGIHGYIGYPPKSATDIVAGLATSAALERALRMSSVETPTRTEARGVLGRGMLSLLGDKHVRRNPERQERSREKATV